MQNQYDLDLGGDDVLEISLSGIKGINFPLVDIFVNSSKILNNVPIKANIVNNETQTIKVKGDFSDFENLGVAFVNDEGRERIDVNSIKLNGEEADLSQSLLFGRDGKVKGETQLFTEGLFAIHKIFLTILLIMKHQYKVQLSHFPGALATEELVAPVIDAPILEEPITAPPKADFAYDGQHQLEIDLTSVHSDGAPMVNVLVNGVLVMQNYSIDSELVHKESETLSIMVNDASIESVSVEFMNDNGPRRVDLLAARIDGVDVDLANASYTTARGETHDGLLKGHWNGSFNIPVNGDVVTMQESMVEAVPEFQAFEEITTQEEVVLPVQTQNTIENSTDWGGADANMYRGEYGGRERSIDDADASSLTITIDPGTSVAAIRQIIDQVPEGQHLTLHFAEGEHVFNDNLIIERGDITIEGAGRDKTTFVADFDGPTKTLIQIQSGDIRNDVGSNNGRWMPDQSEFVGTVAKDFDLGDHTLTLSDVDGIEIGDILMVYKQGHFKSHMENEEFGSLMEVSSVNGNSVTFTQKVAFASDMIASNQSLNDIKVYKTDLLENVTVQDFAVRYNITAADAYNPNGLPLDDLTQTIQYNFYQKYAAGPTSDGYAHYGHHRAISISGTHEANVQNLHLHDIGSNGLFLSANLEMYVDNLRVAHSFNKGTGGNGYGLEYDKTYYSTFTNLEFIDLRHGLSANIIGGNGYNNFHVKYTDANLDFHGGRDQGNIYYTEILDARSFYTAMRDEDGTNLPDIRYEYGKAQFKSISYGEKTNAEENTVIWANTTPAEGTKGEGGRFYDAEGTHLAAFHAGGKDHFVARPDGAELKGGFGNDILVSGSGNDVFYGGGNAIGKAPTNSDAFVFYENSGNDRIMDFQGKFDVMAVEAGANGKKIADAQDILNAAKQVGDDVVIDLGQGNSTTLVGTELNELSEKNFDVFNFQEGY